VKTKSVQARHYQIPLPKTLSDSTHGEITHFTLVTAQVRADGGQEGLGYTYTVGKTGGAAILALIEDDLAPLLIDEDPRRI